MALTTLRNQVVLLARTGADTDALTLHTALEHLATRDSYGPEAVRLETAVAAATGRMTPTARDQASQNARSLTELPEVLNFGLVSIDRASGR